MKMKGLPREQLDYYLVRDYNRNDRIGKELHRKTIRRCTTWNERTV